MPNRTKGNTLNTGFLFATGIENSYPVITGKDGRDLRRDEMESCGHYQHWRHDFELVKSLGIGFLRYGPPYYTTHLGPGKYDWSFADETFTSLKERHIVPIADLCHFGVPDWIGGFQNPDWPSLFSEYAAAFAARYPWVRFFTPVNEIRVCAHYSAMMGTWNERLKSERAEVNAIRNMARATILAEQAILRITPDACFIQSEATTCFHAAVPAMRSEADRRNETRFVPLDLCYGHTVSAEIYEYLLDNGFTGDEYRWFREHGSALNGSCIMGKDYYVTNEQEITRDGKVQPSGEIFGYYALTHEYYERYRLPVMYTETNNLSGVDALYWLRKQWANVMRLRQNGVPMLGFTWYSLTDQVDWDSALQEDNGRVNPVGLFDLDRRIRPVGEKFRELISDWSPVVAEWRLGS